MTTTGAITKLGFCSISALDRPLVEAAALCAGLGIDGLEITQRLPHLAPDAGVAQARDAGVAVRDAGLEVLAFGSYLGTAEPAAPGEARRAAALAAAMGAPILRVWAEPAAGGGDRSRVVALLREACDAAADHGVEVAVERHVGSHAERAEDALALLADVERPNVSLNYQVLDLLPVDAIEQQPADARALAPRARYMHLKNYRRVEGEPRLQPGGALDGGALDVRAIATAAIDAGYRGPASIEFLSFEPLPLEEKLRAEVAFVRSWIA